MKQKLSAYDKSRWGILGVIGVLFALLIFLALSGLLGGKSLTGIAENMKLQNWTFCMGMGVLVAVLVVVWLNEFMRDSREKPLQHGRWYFPLVSGALALSGMCLAYTLLGMWPIGDKTGMIVDMHHQYAPLLAKLRDMLLHGGNPFYTFEAGLGVNFLSMFGYYLASPFNVLLVLFPENLLTEGILVITLLKNALSAFFFAMCVQYVYKRQDFCVPMVSVMYALMTYMLAYSWNIMWLDVVMTLPLVVLGFERLMRTGRFLGYVLPLAYALYANYYIGFMLCLFMVLYYVVFALRSRRTPAEQLRGFRRFAVGSALGGGLVMFLLIPVYLALQHTSAAGGGLPELASNFDMFELLGRHLYNTTPTIRSGNLPNIYCGVLTVLLLPLFATMKQIPLRRRLCYLALVGVLALSFVLNWPNLIWHGLHAPNDLPYRFSFLYSFTLLLIAYETLMHLREVSSKQAALSFLGLVAYLMLEEHFGEEAYDFKSIYYTLFFAAVYTLVILLVSRKRVRMRVAYSFLLLAVTLEMVTNAGGTLRVLDANEHYTKHVNYVDNDTTEAVRQAVDQAQEIGDAAMGGEFYRMEFFPRRTFVDPAMFGYRGITLFSSSNYYTTTRLMGSLGYPINGVNSHYYKGFMPVIDSLLGIRYVISNTTLDARQLTQVGQAGSGANQYTIYENADALPVGYVVDPGVKSWEFSYYDPIVTQNTLLARMTGREELSLYTIHPMTASGSSGVQGNVNGSNSSSFSMNPGGKSGTAAFTTTLTSGGQTFIYVDCRAAKTITAKLSGSASGSWTLSAREPYFQYAGELQVGDTVTVDVTAESAVSGNIYVVTLNEEVYRQVMDTLRAGGMKVTDYSDSHIQGTVSSQGGTLFTTIPYDTGWTVKVDGKKVETYGVADALLAFDVEAGEHTVEQSYTPGGLWAGIAISGVCLILVILIALITRKKLKAPEKIQLLLDDETADSETLSLPGEEEEAPVRLEPLDEEPGEPESAGEDPGTEWKE